MIRWLIRCFAHHKYYITAYQNNVLQSILSSVYNFVDADFSNEIWISTQANEYLDNEHEDKLA